MFAHSGKGLRGPAALCLLLLAGTRIGSAQAADSFTIKADPAQVFFPGPAEVTVTNTGTETISRMTLRVSELMDRDTNGTLTVPEQTFDSGEMPVKPGSDAILHVTLGSAPGAGTYTGNLRFRTDSGVSREVALTVRARRAHALVLFIGVLLLGYIVSLLLQWWLESSPRARVLVSLDRVYADLTGLRDDIQTWLAANHCQAPETMGRLGQRIARLRETLDGSGGLAAEDLRSRDAEARAAATAMSAFRLSLEQAANHHPNTPANPNRLSEVVAELDDVHEAPPDRYQAALEEVIAHPGLAVAAAAPQAAPGPNAVTRIKLKVARVLLVIMPALVFGVPLVVAVLIAYLTIYDPRKDFGSVRDYINLFVQSLGVSQAGAQVAKRGRDWAATSARQAA